MSSSSSYQDLVDDYSFNDLSKSKVNHTDGCDADESNKRGTSESRCEDLPRPKRIACVVCRKRKLRCDGNKPSCGKCTRLGHRCAYDEVRKKSGPKRGYVKALEARLGILNPIIGLSEVITADIVYTLAQVETLLKTQEPQDPNGPHLMSQDGLLHQPDFATSPGINIGINNVPTMYPGQDRYDAGAMQTSSLLDTTLGGGDPLTWELIGLGLDEPLPPQDVIEELHEIYFEKCHPSGPMVHRARYLAAMNLPEGARPPVSLRYAIWTHAASVTNKYFNLQSHFYDRARKYLEEAEMKGHGENIISIAYAQTWILIAIYEFKLMFFPRAWMSTGRAIRLAQMMGLHRLDGAGLEVKQCLPAPRDWTEREERRRTFWLAFCIDRYASIGTGWPMTIEEKDVLTMLPASEEAYNKGNQPSQTMPLNEALSALGAANLSPFAGVVLMAYLFGRNLIHLHRPDTDDRDDDLNGEFWKRHRAMDNILNTTALSLPSHLKLPAGISDPNIVFSNMNIHTSAICLHQAAISKAEQNHLPPTVSADSQVRCITAAAEIAKIMRMVSHIDLSRMNPFISFCLYVAARVFVQYLKIRPGDDQGKSSLQFLLTAMEALKRKNPLTSSFLVQLEADMRENGVQFHHDESQFPFGRDEETGVPLSSTKANCVGFSNTYAPPPPPPPPPPQQIYSSQDGYVPFHLKPLPRETVVQERMHGSMSSSPATAMGGSPEGGLPAGSSASSSHTTPGSDNRNTVYTPPPINDIATPGYGHNGQSQIYFHSQQNYMTGLASEPYLSRSPEKRHGSFELNSNFLDGNGATSGDLIYPDVLSWEMQSPMNSGVDHGNANR